ncbi:hypothetical protein Lpp227_00485 [Lacticaseibacillus paracasei subsp. paracasei Lpp227]|nr:hypothetical protein Lpp227_00485 [Lacticaseibacillus paracasei subsp. paracasei Lpp227]
MKIFLTHEYRQEIHGQMKPNSQILCIDLNKIKTTSRIKLMVEHMRIMIHSVHQGFGANRFKKVKR